MSRPPAIAAWLATDQPHIGLAYAGRDVTIADVKAEVVRLDGELAMLRSVHVSSSEHADAFIDSLCSALARAATTVEQMADALADMGEDAEELEECRDDVKDWRALACVPEDGGREDRRNG
jgi:hypothetical protein